MIKEEFMRITQSDPNIVEKDGEAFVWSNIWSYQVPIGTAFLFRPEHTFSAYLEDSSSAEAGNGAFLRICIFNPAMQYFFTLYGLAQYIRCKEFQDLHRISHLNVVNPVPVREMHWIVIQVKDDASINSSASYFELGAVRVRNALKPPEYTSVRKANRFWRGIPYPGRKEPAIGRVAHPLETDHDRRVAAIEKEIEEMDEHLKRLRGH